MHVTGSEREYLIKMTSGSLRLQLKLLLVASIDSRLESLFGYKDHLKLRSLLQLLFPLLTVQLPQLLHLLVIGIVNLAFRNKIQPGKSEVKVLNDHTIFFEKKRMRK